MRRQTFALLACGLGLALLVLAWMAPVRAYDPEQSNSRGPTGYRGCVASNFNASETNEELVCDFGSQGVWVFTRPDGIWHQITNQNPAWIFSVRPADASAAATLVASFASGVWAWSYSGYPRHMDPADAERRDLGLRDRRRQ